MTQELDKYKEIFFNIFNVEESEFKTLEYKVTPEWNSMAHIALISGIEEAFGIDCDMDDIFAFTSYEKGKDILKTRFGINL